MTNAVVIPESKPIRTWSPNSYPGAIKYRTSSGVLELSARPNEKNADGMATRADKQILLITSRILTSAMSVVHPMSAKSY